MNDRGLPSWQQSRPERWWWWLVVALVVWALQWIRAASDSPYVVEVTVGRLLGSLGVQVLLIGFSVFRAGVLYAEHRRRLGRAVSFVRPEQSD
jgi:hypothetical protein